MLRYFTVRYCGNRLFEWIMAGIFVAVSIELAIWPQAVGASNFRYLPLDNIALPILLLVIGASRIGALLANGRFWPQWTPKVRAFGALAAALIWFELAAALAVYVVSVGRPPSPGIPVYLGLMLGEIITCYRAALASDGSH